MDGHVNSNNIYPR